MNISATRASSYPVSNNRPSTGNGPDDVYDEFNNGRANDGPDAVVDEFNHSRGDSSYNSYDSWSGSGDSGGGSYGLF
jgi:hypothetical protein